MGKRTNQLFVTQKHDGSWYSNMRYPAVIGANGEEIMPSRPIEAAGELMRKELKRLGARAERKQQ